MFSSREGRVGLFTSGTVGPDPDETIVSDIRGELSPAEVVQEKLRRLLWGRAETAPKEGNRVDFRRLPR